MSEASKKHAKLKQLSKSAQDNIWQMLKLADEILKDPEYVDQYGGEAALIESFQKKEFSHFGGSPSLPELLRAFRANPRKATWAEYQFNVWAMIDLAKPDPEPRERKTNWKARAKAAELEVKQLRTTLEDYQVQLNDLRKKLEESELERGRLEGRIIELDRRRVA